MEEIEGTKDDYQLFEMILLVSTARLIGSGMRKQNKISLSSQFKKRTW